MCALVYDFAALSLLIVFFWLDQKDAAIEWRKILNAQHASQLHRGLTKKLLRARIAKNANVALKWRGIANLIPIVEVF